MPLLVYLLIDGKRFCRLFLFSSLQAVPDSLRLPGHVSRAPRVTSLHFNRFVSSAIAASRRLRHAMLISRISRNTAANMFCHGVFTVAVGSTGICGGGECSEDSALEWFSVSVATHGVVEDLDPFVPVGVHFPSPRHLSKVIQAVGQFNRVGE